KMLGIFVNIKKGVVLKICPVYHHVLKLGMMPRSEFERLLVGSFINKRLSIYVDDNTKKEKQNRQNLHKKSRFIRQLTAGGINIFSSRTSDFHNNFGIFQSTDIVFNCLLIGLLKIAVVNGVVFNQIDFARHVFA